MFTFAFRLLGCIGLLLTALVGVGQTQTLSLDDLDHLTKLSSPRISPDGKSIALVVAKSNFDDNRFENHLVLVDVATGNTQNLTFDRPTLRHPRWSPSGDQLAFIANDSSGDKSQSQVFVLSMRGGEARIATAATRGVVFFEWSAGGDSLFYIGADVPDTKPNGQQRHNKSFVAGHHDYLATAPPPKLHVWTIPIAGGEADRVSSNEVVADGVMPWLDVARDAICFHGFPADRPGDRRRSELYVIDMKTGFPRSFDDELRHVFWGRFSPNGQRLAYCPNGGQLFSSLHVCVGDTRGGVGQKVTGTIDRNFWQAVWMPDGRSLLVGANDAARVSLWHQPLSGQPSKLDLGILNPYTRFATTPDFDVSASGGIAFVASEPQRPAELYWLPTIDGTGTPKRLTNYNAGIAALKLGRVEEIIWQGPDGFSENGILIYPPGFDPDRRYPLVLVIHGGPLFASTTEFDELGQLLAAQGFLVFSPNYRGSDNLGNRYQSAVINDAGVGPGKDVMAGLEAVKKLGFVDESRIGVSGWSYGGYMTTWLIGTYPHVWRAAMAGAPVTDYVDSYALSDINTLFGGALNAKPSSPTGQLEWLKQSPIAHVHRATTPTLILCNTGDVRVPITQSYKLYHALDDIDVPVKFVAYPIPGHWPGDPVHERDVYRRWCDWFRQRFELPRDAPAQ